MADTDKQKKPEIAYRVQLEKRIQINKSFSERRNQAVAMRILSFGLFGQKRYQNLYLTCSLNCFHLALKIANNIHQRVPGLAMIIKFETVQVLQYFSSAVNDKYFEQKKYSKIIIKLTRNPTEDDRKQPGFNPGLSNDQVQQPLSEVIHRKKRDNKRQDRRQDKRQDRRQDRRRQNNQRGKQYQRYNKDRRDQKKSYSTRRYRQNTHENVRENQEFRRGERKTRGGGQRGNNTSRRQQNRQYKQKQERNPRRDQRRQNEKEQSNYREKRNDRDERGDRRNERDQRDRRDQKQRRDRKPKRGRYDDQDD